MSVKSSKKRVFSPGIKADLRVVISGWAAGVWARAGRATNRRADAIAAERRVNIRYL